MGTGPAPVEQVSCLPGEVVAREGLRVEPAGIVERQGGTLGEHALQG